MHSLAFKVFVTLFLLAAVATTTLFVGGASCASWRAAALLDSRSHDAALAWLNRSRSAGLDNADLQIQLRERIGDSATHRLQSRICGARQCREGIHMCFSASSCCWI